MTPGSGYEDWRDEANARIGVARLGDGTELVPKKWLDEAKAECLTPEEARAVLNASRGEPFDSEAWDAAERKLMSLGDVAQSG